MSRPSLAIRPSCPPGPHLDEEQPGEQDLPAYSAARQGAPYGEAGIVASGLPRPQTRGQDPSLTV